jgi:hypothetical protein
VTDHPDKLISRTLVLGWCGWLMISWLGCLAVFPPRATELHVARSALDQAQRHLPAVRGTLIAAMVGISLVWPALRLTQHGITRPAMRCVGDLLCLLLVLQVVIWPLRVLVHWTGWQTLWIDLAVVGWSLPIGLWVYLGLRRGTSAARLLAMALCLATLLGLPLLSLLLDRPALASVNPIAVIWTITQPMTSQPVDDLIQQTMVVAAMLGVGLGAVAMLPAGGGSHDRPLDT